MPSDRQLRELRSLTPWNWDTKAAKHPPGKQALRDFERIEKAYLARPGQGRTRQHDDTHQGKCSASDGHADKGAPAGSASSAKESAAFMGWEAHTPGARDSIPRNAGPRSKRQRKSAASDSQQEAVSAGRASSGRSPDIHRNVTCTPATVAYDPARNAPADTPTNHCRLKQQGSGTLTHAPTPVPLGLGCMPTPCPQQQQQQQQQQQGTPSDHSITQVIPGQRPDSDGTSELAPAAAAASAAAEAQGAAGADSLQLQQQPPAASPPAGGEAAAAATTSRMPPPKAGSSRRPPHKRQYRRTLLTGARAAAASNQAYSAAPPPQQQQQQEDVRMTGKRRAGSAEGDHHSGGDDDDAVCDGTPCASALMELAALGLQQQFGSDTAQHVELEPEQTLQDEAMGCAEEDTPELGASLTLLSMAPAARSNYTMCLTHPYVAAGSDLSKGPPAASSSPPACAPAHPPASNPQAAEQQRQQQQHAHLKCVRKPLDTAALGGSVRAMPPSPLLQRAKHTPEKLQRAGAKQQQAPRSKQTSLPFPGLRTTSSSTTATKAAAGPLTPAIASGKENVPPRPPSAPNTQRPTASCMPPAIATQQRPPILVQQQQRKEEQRGWGGPNPQLGPEDRLQAGVGGDGHELGSRMRPTAPGMHMGTPEAGTACCEPPAQTSAACMGGPGAVGSGSVSAATNGGVVGCGVGGGGAGLSSLVSAASMAALHHIVRAVAAYCHGLHIKPSGDNVQQAQAIIALLHAGQPAQACELLHRLRPQQQPADEQGLATREGLAATQLPIAPLALPTLPPLDHDWCAALHPSITLTLHALVAGHKALRDAVCGAATPFGSAAAVLPSAGARYAPAPAVSAASTTPSCLAGAAAAALPAQNLHATRVPVSPAPVGLAPAPIRACLRDQSNVYVAHPTWHSAVGKAGDPAQSSAQAGCTGVYTAAH
uniref:Uncharacterized protein n=1 Tax=Dunaliella tertiolecta TaxID=3047 RepID=A0A7S3QXC0_DUNTE